MHRTNCLIGLGFLAALTACDASGESDLGVVIQESTNMPAELARCIGDLAAETLSEDGQAFLVAGMRKDKAALKTLTERMPMDEVMQAGMFMVTASSQCDAQEYMDAVEE